MSSSNEARDEALAAPAQVLKAARLVVLDVDGTLTDGRIVLVVGEKGEPSEAKCFDVRDGLGLRWLIEAGVRVAWISGRSGAAVRARAKELGVEIVREGVKDKRAALAALQSELGLTPAVTIAMGDDLPDLGLAALAALFACPSDAQPELRERAGLVTHGLGGRGAVRELAEAILKAQGRWQALIASQAR